MKKLNSILLVDDSDATNFFNKVLIERAGITESISVCKNGKEGLEYIISNIDTPPELIILDIKMPVMDGFEFLDALRNYESKIKDSLIIVMLSSSMSPSDIERAKRYSFVKGYLNKPLNAETIKELLRRFE